MPIDFESIPEEDAHDYPVTPFLDFAREQERPEPEGSKRFAAAQREVEHLLEADATPWSIVYALWGRFKFLDSQSGHVYLSTACLHEEHAYCQAKKGQAGPKKPGECKFCTARCICDCHKEADDVAS
ncbi:hypothetical protein ACIO1C_29615 [Streptomyces sp. NPDC087420]|uniref:hypothetical protein n=1 Tax=Streptomyces sp. NPDC087420 TaxID=3365785 RepID=UPI00383578CE